MRSLKVHLLGMFVLFAFLTGAQSDGCSKRGGDEVRFCALDGKNYAPGEYIGGAPAPCGGSCRCMDDGTFICAEPNCWLPCSNDSECREGWECVGGTCVQEEPNCYSSSDCSDGEYCTTEDGECLSWCPVDLICDCPYDIPCACPMPACPDMCAGTCVPRGCELDGVKYAPDDRLGSCGECSCTASGQIVCLEIACPAGCFSDADCPTTWTCEGEIVCPPGAACFAADQPGVCTPPDETKCASDSDCPKGTHCEGSSVCPPNVICVWEGEPGLCVPDRDCGLIDCALPLCMEGYHLETPSGECCPTCVPDTSSDKCFASEQCPDGEYCTTEDGDCLSPCPPGTLCVDVCAGVCKPRECTWDQCGPAPMSPNYLCPDGKTWAGPGPCEHNADGVCGWTWTQCPTLTCSPEAKNVCPAGTTCECLAQASTDASPKRPRLCQCTPN